MNSITIQRGDTFNIAFQYKVDGRSTELLPDYDLLVGLYDRRGNLIKSGTYLAGDITKDGSIYRLPIDHATSMKMEGDVRMEITVYSESGSVVDHAQDIIVIRFDERKNNSLLNFSHNVGASAIAQHNA